ncbi:MAG TPA: CBS domain-containing protein [Syntrophorhabdales bacterium]|nr:CBS domain-containing protein [Syntrophorhabdales bacterium]
MSDVCEIIADDLRKARRELETYIDVTEEDLMKIYSLALKFAQERRSQQVPIADVMTTDVVSVRPDADIHEAASLLSEKGVGGLPVINDENEVVGVITEADVLCMLGVERTHGFKDLIRHVLGESCLKQQKEGKVRDFMTSPAVVVRPDQDALEAARLLEKKRIKRLPVVDERNRLVGVVTRADIVKVMANR